MKIILISLGIVFCALFIDRSAYAGEVRDVSVVQLITTPELFDGQEIRIVGFLRLEFEGDAIYLHREDFEYSITKNSVAIDLTDSQQLAWRKLNNHYVIIEGRFSSLANGHFGMRSGSLQHITRMSNGSVRRTRK